MSLLKQFFSSKSNPDRVGNSNPGVTPELRHHILRIILEATKTDYPAFTSQLQKTYTTLQNEMDLKFGYIQLRYGPGNVPAMNIGRFILESDNLEGVFFAVEYIFNGISQLFMPMGNYEYSGAPESNSGYTFEGSKIINVDSTVVHQEIIVPVIQLLSNKKFEVAHQIYLKAHEHWRNQENVDCLNACGRAFESTMKIICRELWKIDADDKTAGKLIEICFKNKLLPDYLKGHFGFLVKLLETGIPNIRNNVSGHGPADNSKPATDAITQYGLNLTGSNIIFLIELSGIK